MHTILSTSPDPRLSPFVRCFAQREICAQTSSLVQTSLAQLEHTLSFNLADAPVMHYSSGKTALIPRIHLVGTQTRSPGYACFTGHILAFGIFLKPLACWQLFRIPPSALADQEFEAQEVLGPWITELWLKLADCKSFCDRIRVATETLLRFAQKEVPLTRTMAAARTLLQPQWVSSVQQLAHESRMSLRNYQRRFAGEMGISPKLFARVARFQSALDLKRMSGKNWLNIAHEIGYFDQMHMAKEFRSLGDGAPSRLIQMCGDFQPWSIGRPEVSSRVMTREVSSHPPLTP